MVKGYIATGVPEYAKQEEISNDLK